MRVLRSPRTKSVLKLLLTAWLLWLTARSVGGVDLPSPGELELGWILLALALSIPVIGASALRWSFTTRRLGAAISFRHALAEYYLSTLLNQLLPLALAGDLTRLSRHGRHLAQGTEGYGRALRGVLFDRISGQLALLLVVLASAPAWIYVLDVGHVVTVALAFALTLGAALFLVRARPDSGLGLRVRLWLKEASQALVERGALTVQLACSVGVVLGCLAMFYCAARASGVSLSPLSFARVGPLVLAATSLPVAFAGWGIREAATAALFASLALDPARGVAISVVYGVINLVASLPGFVVWLGRT
jgi:uncharacterized membrane protein YbhN (UPF0104 family)